MREIVERWLAERCDEDGPCLIWRLQVSRDGAPLARSPIKDGRHYKVQVRRLVWEARHGSVPDGMLVTYSCGNPRCLACLELVTPADVIKRVWARPDIRARKLIGITKASRARGKLDMDRARYIRASDATLKEVSQELGISMTLASQVRRGLAWREGGNPFAGLGG